MIKSPENQASSLRSLTIIQIVAVFLFNLSNLFALTARGSQAWSATTANTIRVAAERTSAYLPLLKGKRIAVLVNPTSTVYHQHLVDFLIEKNINLKLIFAPEHGFRGDRGAGEHVSNNRDKKTGLPIISLHGQIKKPQPEQLKDIDLLVFDIQDVGVRFYTYISTLHYYMEACAENSIPLLLLDRPNPNGDYIAGPVLDLRYRSFVGMHPVPLVHGLTVGELAQMINGEHWLANGEHCQLNVVPVQNYTHNTHYHLPIKPSPNLRTDDAIRLYPSLALFEATSVSVGRGSEFPFEVLGYPDKDMGSFSFTPEKINGSWSRLNYAGQKLYGEKLKVADYYYFSLLPFMNWLKKFQNRKLTFITRPNFLDKLMGTDQFRKQIAAGDSEKSISKSWIENLKKFQRKRKNYLLYPDSDYIKKNFDQP